MRSKNEFIEEINLRLKAPAIALERIVKGKYLPKIFAEAALIEIEIIQKLIGQGNGKQKGLK